MAKSPIAMPNTMVVLDKNGLGAQCVKDETEDTMNRKQFSRQSTGCRVSNSDLDLPRRTPTPSKQVSLPSVRRKEEQVACSGDGTAASSFDTFARPGGFYSDVQALSSKLNLPSSPTKSDSNGPESKLPYTQNQGTLTDSEEKENVENESEGSSEDEKSTAPSQLLMEFLGCVMEEDFENAEKLCKMILLYEPENPEALKFKPLIEEKLRQEELSDGDSSDDDDDSSDDNEGGDDDDSSSEESDESSEENSANT